VYMRKYDASFLRAAMTSLEARLANVKAAEQIGDVMLQRRQQRSLIQDNDVPPAPRTRAQKRASPFQTSTTLILSSHCVDIAAPVVRKVPSTILFV
jgi:hypothetical protein